MKQAFIFFLVIFVLHTSHCHAFAYSVKNRATNSCHFKHISSRRFNTNYDVSFLKDIFPTPSAESAETIISAIHSDGGLLLNVLGNDLLIFLCATIGIVPLFKWLKASPVLGFLTAGLVMGPAGLKLFSDLQDMETLADFGVLFLLFEQGLELTIARLKSVSKYAFGMGTLQVVLSTAAFFVFPFLGGVQFLEYIVGSDPSVVDITRPDEALVIGAALSLSSSAFVLKILQEKGQISSKFGEAALGILLLQDIAVVPLLVLLPIIENGQTDVTQQITLLGVTILKALLGLGGILVIGGKVIRYLFSIVAKTQSSETFVALCLLVAVGVGALTDSLGLSSTLGAFVAGTLLAESNYRTQIESDLKPFKGLLLGLFFLTTGASVDPYVIQQQLPTVLALLVGLITFKSVIVAALGPFFDLTKAESVKNALVLSGGGEFAFVVLTLADKLHVIPDQLAKILVGVVVLSMALTPTLSNLGDKLANYVEEFDRREFFNKQQQQQNQQQQQQQTEQERLNRTKVLEIDASGAITSSNTLSTTTTNSKKSLISFFFSSPPEYTMKDSSSSSSSSSRDSTYHTDHSHGLQAKNVIVICGFNEVGRTVAQAITAYTKNQGDLIDETTGASNPNYYEYVAFDLNPNIVVQQYRAGKNILYGDGTQPLVLSTAGVQQPKAFIVTYDEAEMALKAVERLHESYPAIPIFAT
jgi:Kef-type K+ transport system membrane component KefB